MENYIDTLKNQFTETLKENEKLRDILTCTAKKLGFTIDKFLEGLLYYDNRIGSFANEVYSDHGVRGALYLKYFINETYHIQRQKILNDYIQECIKNGAKNFIDIGYGAPGLYIENILKNLPNVQLTLVDKFESAQIFAKALLNCLVGEQTVIQKVKFDEYDYDTLTNLGQFDVYVMYDSIEHAKNPTKSLSLIVNNAPHDAKFILSIPIAEKDKIGGSSDEDMHHIEWLTENDAIKWLSDAGLKIDLSSVVKPNEIVDQWSIGMNFYNFIVLCSKI